MKKKQILIILENFAFFRITESCAYNLEFCLKNP